MTAGYLIADVARRTGFSSATLRYYEQIGLLPAPGRTPGGYRVYDDHTVARLAFVARAKQLGCSLEEISDLLAAWDGQRCEPVQERLRTMVDAKIGDAQQRIAELVAFTAQLQQVTAALRVHTPDGPCDDRCGCMGGAEADSTLVQLTATKAAIGEAPVACTLDASDTQGRIRDWQDLLEHASARLPIDGGVRLEFTAGTSMQEVADLAAAEHACCSFFGFAITVDARGLGLEVRTSQDGLPALTALFGAAR